VCWTSERVHPELRHCCVQQNLWVSSAPLVSYPSFNALVIPGWSRCWHDECPSFLYICCLEVILHYCVSTSYLHFIFSVPVFIVILHYCVSTSYLHFIFSVPVFIVVQETDLSTSILIRKTIPVLL
jgi:hypothetical protein